jgi:hypothetical protein
LSDVFKIPREEKYIAREGKEIAWEGIGEILDKIV